MPWAILYNPFGVRSDHRDRKVSPTDRCDNSEILFPDVFEMPPFPRSVVCPAGFFESADHGALRFNRLISEESSSARAGVSDVGGPIRKPAAARMKRFTLIARRRPFSAIGYLSHVYLIAIVQFHRASVISARVHGVLVDVGTVVENMLITRVVQIIMSAGKMRAGGRVARAANVRVTFVSGGGFLDP